MSQLPVDLVLFDLTGTTVADGGVMEGALRGALRQHGVGFTDDDILSMRGAAKGAAFRGLLEGKIGITGTELGERAETLHATFRELLREGLVSGPVEAVSGAESTFRWLRERGAMIGAVTAMEKDVSDELVARLGWDRGLLDCKVASDEVLRGRPAPYMIFLAMMRVGVVDVRRVAVVGDTPLDLRSGANAGAGWIVGVLGGVHGVDSLGATAHTHLLPSVADLPRIFEGLERDR
jgi:phosphonatase-like hydrolase